MIHHWGFVWGETQRVVASPKLRRTFKNRIDSLDERTIIAGGSVGSSRSANVVREPLEMAWQPCPIGTSSEFRSSWPELQGRRKVTGNEPTDATCCFVLFSFASFVLWVFSAIYSSFPSLLLFLFSSLGNLVYSDCHLFSSSTNSFFISCLPTPRG